MLPSSRTRWCQLGSHGLALMCASWSSVLTAMGAAKSRLTSSWPS